MASETYRKFLESESGKNPLKLEESMGKERFRFSWENGEERSVQTKPSDIIDSIYLGRDMEETVVVDRRVAAMLQDRLKGLEEENIHMRKRAKIMKIIMGALLLTVAIISLILLRLSFSQIFF